MIIMSDDYHDHIQPFTEKVAKVRLSTADAPVPTFTRAPPGVSFRQFWPRATVAELLMIQPRFPGSQINNFFSDNWLHKELGLHQI